MTIESLKPQDRPANRDGLCMDGDVKGDMEDQPELKLCKDCKHAFTINEDQGRPATQGEWMCRKTKKTEPVLGRTSYKSCFDTRNTDCSGYNFTGSVDYCGLQAVWFDPK